MIFLFARFRISQLIASLAVSLSLLVSSASADGITVFAAASLKNVLDEITTSFTQRTGHVVSISFAGSSALARQIEFGAPANIFISANSDWMDRLQDEGLIVPGSRINLLGNSIVLIAPGQNASPVNIKPNMDLAGMLGDGRLAMALIDAVPAGIYGKAALNSLGVWKDVHKQVVQTDNSRATLALVSLGEAALGIVYLTDALASDAVSVVGTFPAATHPAIIYPAAIVAGNDNPLNTTFLTYLQKPEAREVFRLHGFKTIIE
ncbi:MAG: molybdate ABC transporter substrate-binding protein [Marinosulfonomonas sp.]|nr:molybdate ABC transporter substrate-binding protein [Marinosulfonomonas sp.]